MWGKTCAYSLALSLPSCNRKQLSNTICVAWNDSLLLLFSTDCSRCCDEQQHDVLKTFCFVFFSSMKHNKCFSSQHTHTCAPTHTPVLRRHQERKVSVWIMRRQAADSTSVTMSQHQVGGGCAGRVFSRLTHTHAVKHSFRCSIFARIRVWVIQ